MISNNERLSSLTFLEVTKVSTWRDSDLDGFTFETNDGSVWWALSCGNTPAIKKYNLQLGQFLAFVPLSAAGHYGEPYGIVYFNNNTLVVLPVYKR